MGVDVPGIKKMLPESFRKYPMFDNIYNLECVPIATVQLRFNGWGTEMNDDKNMQDVFDERAFSRSEEQIVADCIDQMHKLFPSSKKLECTWSSVVKLGQSLYREKPGQDKYRPTQSTPIPNFFLAGSYTYQDYLDSMEGATRSGLMVADEIISRADSLKVASDKAKLEKQVA